MRLCIGIMTTKEEKQATEISSFKAYHDNNYKKKRNKMSYFPFFRDIEGQNCLVIGGGRVAARKISRLKSFGVKITVIAPSIDSDIEIMERTDENISIKKRAFTQEDIEKADFVIAAAGEEVDKEAARLCKERSIPVNVVDNQELCDFIFPSIIRKGDMVAGFVTGGKSPHVAAKLRRDCEMNISDNIEDILDYLARIRKLAKDRISDERKRAAYIREVSEFCMKVDRVCSSKEENAFLQKYLDNRSETVLPGAALVGAGCGSYELITIKGLNEIRRAEVIVYDDLIDEHLLEFAPESCELIYAGKRSGRHSKAQEEINELLVEKALEGRYVVRLKGGDPYVFGRGGEEALALKAHGIPVHEVPGVTSSIGLCGMAGIPVTHRGASRGFHVITGHTADNLPPEVEEIRWKSYAKLDETFVFLMGLKSIDMITGKLMRYGKPEDTAVAVIHGNNSDGTYVKLVGTLSDIAEKVKTADFPSPAIIVVGEVASLELTD